MKLIVITKCVSIDNDFAKFHFDGTFQGHKVTTIKVAVDLGLMSPITKGCEYILYLTYKDVKDTIMTASLNKWKSI